MSKYLIIICSIYILGCSFKAPESQWQIRSKNAFNSYSNNFLSGNETLAKNDLNRAVRHINVSADLNKLARLYLSVCALNIATGINDKCEQYLDIKDLTQTQSLSSYYALLQGILKTGDIEHLPLNYQEFASHLLNKNYNQAFKAIELINKPSSRFIAASIIKNKLTANDREKLIKDASYYGYKNIVIFWLEQSLIKSESISEQQKLIKKIQILKNNQ
ncbi:MAG: hypothetical protein HQL46_11840 [Gammaproteobacteria bacterium]|nr:hypothetical protein [Gammaproteobacteria bacterium]